MAENRSLPVGCVIMASGLSTRFGSNKLLAPFGPAGEPLLCRALDATATPRFAGRVVVTRSPEVQALCESQGVPCILHALPGRNDTVRLGLEALLAQLPDLAGCMFLPGDQPLLQRDTVESMVGIFGWHAETWAERGQTREEIDRAIFRLGHRYKNDPAPLLGSPVLFGRAYFDALRTLPEGKGGGVILRQHPDCVHAVYIGDRNELRDADTPEELRELEALWKGPWEEDEED